LLNKRNPYLCAEGTHVFYAKEKIRALHTKKKEGTLKGAHTALFLCEKKRRASHTSFFPFEALLLKYPIRLLLKSKILMKCAKLGFAQDATSLLCSFTIPNQSNIIQLQKVKNLKSL